MRLSPDVNHGHPRFDPAPDVRTDLPVRLGRLPEIVPHFLVGPVQRPLLFAGGPPRRAAPGGGGGGHRRPTEKKYSLFYYDAIIIKQSNKRKRATKQLLLSSVKRFKAEP